MNPIGGQLRVVSKPARGEMAFLVRLWIQGRPIPAIVREMGALGWPPQEVDLVLARVCGFLPPPARAGGTGASGAADGFSEPFLAGKES